MGKFSLSDYKAGIKLARRFSDSFGGSAGYDLRKIKKISDLSPARRKRIREAVEYLRPLTQYEYTTKKLDKKSARDYMRAVYNRDTIPASITRVPVQAGQSVKIKTTKRGEKRGVVKKVSGGEVVRIYFADSERAAIAGDDLYFIRKLIDDYKPDAIGYVTGDHVARAGNVPRLDYTTANAVNYLERIGGKYGAGGLGTLQDWFSGVDFYYFSKGGNREFVLSEKIKTEKRRALFDDMEKARESVSYYEKKIETAKQSKKDALKRAKGKERAAISKIFSDMLDDYGYQLKKRLAKHEKARAVYYGAK